MSNANSRVFFFVLFFFVRRVPLQCLVLTRENEKKTCTRTNDDGDEEKMSFPFLRRFRRLCSIEREREKSGRRSDRFITLTKIDFFSLFLFSHFDKTGRREEGARERERTRKTVAYSGCVHYIRRLLLTRCSSRLIVNIVRSKISQK